jgi:hypothetical protein
MNFWLHKTLYIWIIFSSSPLISVASTTLEALWLDSLHIPDRIVKTLPQTPDLTPSLNHLMCLDTKLPILTDLQTLIIP